MMICLTCSEEGGRGRKEGNRENREECVCVWGGGVGDGWVERQEGKKENKDSLKCWLILFVFSSQMWLRLIKFNLHCFD